MFSKACEYGIKSAIFIVIKSFEGQRVSPKEIAKEIESPHAFTAKILQALVKHNIVKSVKGVNGGFEVDKNDVKTITLSKIVNAIDGDSIYNRCGLGLSTCSENHPCPFHNKFKIVRDELKNMLENTNLEELAFNIKSGTSFLKI